MGIVEQIFIAPGYGESMAAVDAADALAGIGLRGDRYVETGSESPATQITLIEIEHIEAFVASTGLGLTPSEPRRNLVTRGVRLNDLCGKQFTVGKAVLEGLELCEPCKTFAIRTHPEVLPYFVHKGGLRAQIVQGGAICVGDTLET